MKMDLGRLEGNTRQYVERKVLRKGKPSIGPSKVEGKLDTPLVGAYGV